MHVPSLLKTLTKVSRASRVSRSVHLLPLHRQYPCTATACALQKNHPENVQANSNVNEIKHSYIYRFCFALKQPALKVSPTEPIHTGHELEFLLN